MRALDATGSDLPPDRGQALCEVYWAMDESRRWRDTLAPSSS